MALKSLRGCSLFGLALTSAAGAVNPLAPPIMLAPRESVPVNPAPMKITNNLKLALRPGADQTLYFVSAQISDQEDQRYKLSELAAFGFSRTVQNWTTVPFSEKVRSASDAIKALASAGVTQETADILAIKVTGASVEFLMSAPDPALAKSLAKGKFTRTAASQALVDEIYSVTPQEHVQANIALARQQMKLMGSLSSLGSMRSWSETSLGFAAPNPRSLVSFLKYLRDTEKVNGTAELVGPVAKISWTATVGENAEAEALEKAKSFCEKAAKSKISCFDWGYVVRFKSN